jgi:hypothetical protein
MCPRLVLAMEAIERFRSNYAFELEPPIGIEPMTYALREACSRASGPLLHRCHTQVLPLHPKPRDFQVTGSTTRSTPPYALGCSEAPAI